MIQVQRFKQNNPNKQVVEKVEKMQVDRRNSAKEDYQKGIELLAQAKCDGFQNKAVLLQASQYINQAQCKDRNNCEYKTTSAYLFILVGENAKAQVKLSEILTQEPQNKKALQLQTRLNRVQKMSQQDLRLAKWNAFQSLPHPQSETDFDNLYDRTEAFIKEEVTTLMQATISSNITINKSEAQRQVQLLEEMQGLKALIDAKIATLYEDMDVEELNALCRPLNIYIKKLKHSTQYNQRFIQLEETIQVTRQAAKNLKIQLKTANPSEQILEEVFDICDAIADELDHMGESVDISSLEGLYENLLADINRLQEALDS